MAPSDLTPRQVAAELRGLLERGARLRAVGAARKKPSSLLSAGYTPRHKLQVFDATFYLTNIRSDDNFRFFVAYVVLQKDPDPAARAGDVHPRIVYKDSSLVWRVATHYIRSERENWIGKGELKWVPLNGDEVLCSAEETTNLPLEIQAGLDEVSRRAGRVRRDHRAIGLVLRKAPHGRAAPYADFTTPRRRAASDPANLIHGGAPVAWFERENDPASLRFAPGFEPDFAGGFIEESRSASRLYGGPVRKLRFLSRNARIQYQFIAAPRQVWVIPPQTLGAELSSYGTRTIDVEAAEDLCVPGYEYHYMDETEDPPRLHSQIPAGFAGAASEVDDSRADASAWLDKLPVIQEFRRAVLRR